MLTWRVNSEYNIHELYRTKQSTTKMVAWIVQRPPYCDRGHWQVNCELPGLDGSDGFPRYFMDFKRAVAETEDFIKWRIKKGEEHFVPSPDFVV